MRNLLPFLPCLLLSVACEEPDKEVVDVDSNIFQEAQTSISGVVGDWTMTSLNEEPKPELLSERWQEDGGSSYEQHRGIGYGLSVTSDGTVESVYVESQTLLVDGVIDENESYVYSNVEGTGTIERSNNDYSMSISFTDSGATLQFACTLPAATQLDCTYIEDDITNVVTYEIGDPEKAVSDLSNSGSDNTDDEGSDGSSGSEGSNGDEE